MSQSLILRLLLALAAAAAAAVVAAAAVAAAVSIVKAGPFADSSSKRKNAGGLTVLF